LEFNERLILGTVFSCSAARFIFCEAAAADVGNATGFTTGAGAITEAEAEMDDDFKTSFLPPL
jgi:hypothetical protein